MLFPSRLLIFLATASVILVAQPVHAQTLWKSSCATAKPILLKAAKAGGAKALTARRELGVVAVALDNPADIVAAWKPMYQNAPDSWQAAAYWADFVAASNKVGDNSALSAAARAILANKNTPPFLRASARDALAQVAFDVGKSADAAKAWASSGYIRDWRIIGPFNNASRSGFGTAFAPEKQIDFKESASGIDGMALKWLPLSLKVPDGTVHIRKSLGQSLSGVYYAVTSVNVAEDSDAMLALEVGGASEIFVNGVSVLRDPIYRTPITLVSDPLAVRVSLKKGANTILVKVAEDRDDNVLFRLRLTDDSGETPLRLPVNPLLAQTYLPVRTAPALPPSPPTVSEPIALLRRRIAAAPDDVEAQLCLGVCLRDNGDYEASVAACRRAVALAPDSGIAHWELSVSLSYNDERNAASEEREVARKRDPRIVAAQLDYLEEMDEALKPNERIKVLKALLAVNPASSNLLWALAGAQSSAQMGNDALRTARRATAAAPGADNQAELYGWLIGGRKQPEADAVLKAALVRFPSNPGLIAINADRLVEKGDLSGSFLAYQKFLDGNTPNPGAYFQFADAYMSARMFPKAAALLTRAQRDFPQSALIRARLGDVQSEMGNKVAALLSYREAIRLDPSRMVLREKVQLLAGEKSVAKLVTLTDAAPLLAKLPRAADNPGVSEVRVLDEGYVIVYPDFAQAHYTHEIITCLDSAAAEKYQQYPIGTGTATGTGTVEVARIIKPNGKIVDCKDKGEDEFAAFPSLAPGDTIDLVYRVDDYPTGGLAGKFWTSWFFATPDSRVNLSRFVLVTPKEMSLTLSGHGGLPEPTLKEAGKWRIREWNVSSKGDARPEILASPHRDSGMWLDASTFADWREVVGWYSSLSAPRCLPDAVVRAKTDDLTKDAKTEEEKIRAVVRFVADEIPYQSSPFRLSAFVPTEGKSVIGDSYGDCKDKAALTVAMLKHLGIKANMVLLSGRSDGITPYLPGPRFNHAITVIETANGPLWVDATADSLEYGNLPFEDQGVPALVIADSTNELTVTPVMPVEKSQLTETVSATLDAAGGVKGSQRLTATGGIGWLLRMAFRRVPESSQNQALTAFFSAILPDSQPANTRISGLAAADSPVEMSADFVIPDFAQATDRLIIARVPWASNRIGNSATPLKMMRTDAELRRTDLEVASSRIRQTSRVTMTIPAGWRVKDLAPEIKGDAPFGSYRFTYALSGNVLTAERMLLFTAQRVAAKDLSAFLKFDDAIEKQGKAPLLLEKL